MRNGLPGVWTATSDSAGLRSMARPVLMSLTLADDLGFTDRLTHRTETTGVILVTEEELLAKCTVDAYIEWGYPDAQGRFTPTIYTGTRVPA